MDRVGVLRRQFLRLLRRGLGSIELVGRPAAEQGVLPRGIVVADPAIDPAFSEAEVAAAEGS